MMSTANAGLQTELANPATAVKSMCRALGNPGLEVALLGVDGVGKTTVAAALQRLAFPVKVIVMGSAHFRCWQRLEPFLPWPAPQLTLHCERMLRRWLGFCLKCVGWIVVYDRHPIEQLNPRPDTLVSRINNWFFALYSWPVDLTFWLTGDYQEIYQRKPEFTPERLCSLDKHISEVLAYAHIDHVKVNVTDKNLEALINDIVLQVSARYKAGVRHQLKIPPTI